MTRRTTADTDAAGAASAGSARSREPGTHWLGSEAANAGLELPLPAVPDRATLRRAWPAVVRACRASEEKFTERAATHFRIGVADLSTWDPQAVRLIPEAVARKYGVLAISFTDDNVVAVTSDPTNRQAIREIGESSGRQPVLLLASPARLDRALERMTGYELLRSMRRSLATQALPVIVQSSSDDPRDEIALLEAGADDYLVKPILPERVEARVRAVLRRSGTEIAS